MTQKDFDGLAPGDIVRLKDAPFGFMVTDNFKGRVTGIRTIDITNPEEYDLIIKCNRIGKTLKLEKGMKRYKNIPNIPL